MPDQLPTVPTRIRVLYVEDDRVTAKLVKRKLEREGYEVQLAHDGKEGLSSFDSWSPHVLAVDQDMPLCSGLEVIRTLRDRGPLPPTIMVTATGNENIAVQAMKMGAGDYLVKDVDGGFLELLPTVITSVLDNYRVAGEREQALKELRESEARYQSLFENVPVGLYRSSPTGEILEANPALVAMLKYPDRETLLVVQFSDLFADPSVERIRSSQLEDSGKLDVFEWRIQRYDGTFLWIIENVQTVRTADGDRTYHEGSFQDITQRRSEEDKLTYLATHDALTGLPNRVLFDDRLRQALTFANRKQHALAVFLIDLDNFKEINDTWGHDVGDVVLRTLATRVKSCLRQSDTAARLGGDEFIVLLPKVSDPEKTTLVAQRIISAIKQPVLVDDLSFSLTASMGIACNVGGDIDAADLIRKADHAMYKMKRNGKDDFQHFVGEID